MCPPKKQGTDQKFFDLPLKAYFFFFFAFFFGFFPQDPQLIATSLCYDSSPKDYTCINFNRFTEK